MSYDTWKLSTPPEYAFDFGPEDYVSDLMEYVEYCVERGRVQEALIALEESGEMATQEQLNDLFIFEGIDRWRSKIQRMFPDEWDRFYGEPL